MGLTDSVGIGTNAPKYKLDVATGLNQYGFAQTAGTVEFASWIGTGAEIGTVSNHAMRLYAGNGLSQFELLPSGNIGIGLINPTNRMDISHGTERSGTHASNRPLYVTGNLGEAEGIEFRHHDGSQGIGIGKNTIYTAGSYANQDLNFESRGTGSIIMIAGGAERFRFTHTGNLGISVISPNAPLQFSNATVNRKIVLYEVANNEHQFFGFGVNLDGSLRYQVPVIANDHVFYAGTGTVTSGELMRIRGNGNVVVSGTVEVEALITPTLLNSFTQHGAGFAPAAYYKDKMGRVLLRGTVANVNNPTGLVIFNLPVGYRPTSGRLIYNVNANGGSGRVDIMTNGDVLVMTGSAGWINLDGIGFRAD